MKKPLIILLLAFALLACLGVTAMAVNFVGSPGQDDPGEIEFPKPTEPPVKEPEYHDEEGDVVEETELIELVITPIKDKNDAMIESIFDHLERAEEQVVAASDVGQLTPDMYSSLEELKTASEDPQVQGLEMEDLVIADLFDVSLVYNREKLVYLPDGKELTFAIQTSLTQDDVFFLLHNPSGTQWEVVESCFLDVDGMLYISLSELGPMALVVDRYHGGTPLFGPVSPQTGDPAGVLACCLAGAALVLAGGMTLSRKKRKAQ